MKFLYLLFVCLCSWHKAYSFHPQTKPMRISPISLKAINQDHISVEDRHLHDKFEAIAQRLRVSVQSHGFDSKDPKYGIERIRTTISVDPSLGLELTEVAHSTTTQGRGLVLVSHVGGNSAKASAPIEVGDTIVGVGVLSKEGIPVVKEGVMGLDYGATMDLIIHAKTEAKLLTAQDDSSHASILLEFNRLVPREPFLVIVEGVNRKGDPITLEGLAGDNLRQLLQSNGVDVNSSGMNCGGEGSCGTCMVRILEGKEYLNKIPSSSKDPTTGLRTSCQTVIGADNREGSVRISLNISPSEYD